MGMDAAKPKLQPFRKDVTRHICPVSVVSPILHDPSISASAGEGILKSPYSEAKWSEPTLNPKKMSLGVELGERLQLFCDQGRSFQAKVLSGHKTRERRTPCAPDSTAAHVFQCMW